ncbi:MAG: 50S ribosomal protein L25/general stress protein Ctc [Breznakibacter sp.]
MQTIQISGETRTSLGKRATKQLRSEEKVPCVLYGGNENTHFIVEERGFKDLIYTPNVHLVELLISGKSHKAILQDIQYHPVSDKIMHVDFLAITEEKPIIIEVPIKLDGLAEGVKAGGKLQLEIRKLKVKGLAKHLPDTLDINIDNLGLGKTIQVKELAFDNLEILNAKNAVVVSVKLTRAARAAQQGK